MQKTSLRAGNICLPFCRLAISFLVVACSSTLGDNQHRLAKHLNCYKRLGLPIPNKDDAKLAICLSKKTVHRDGVEQVVVKRFPALTGRSWKGGERTPWRGADRAYACWTIDEFSEVNQNQIKDQLSNIALDVVTSDRSISRPSRPFGSISLIESEGKWCQPFWIDRFWMESSADQLIVAIQCHHLGWNDASNIIYDAVCANIPTDEEQSKILCEYAWDFWCLRFRWYSDRRMIVVRLGDILSAFPDLNSPARTNIIDDMRRTITPIRSGAGSAEADIDALRSIDMADDIFSSDEALPNIYWDSTSPFEVLEYEPAYQRLKNRGRDAIPALMQHIDDFRLTRSVGKCNGYIWHVRIADIIAMLMHEATDTEFAYDFLKSEGRGVRLDRGHVEHWLKDENERNQKHWAVREKADFVPQLPKQIEPKADDFHEAIMEGDLPLAARLITENPKIVNSVSSAWEQESNLSETPLARAIRTAEPSVIEFLLDHGADPNLADTADQLPIFWVKDGATAQSLLAKGARWDVRDSNWRHTPLRWAAREGRVDVVRALIMAGAALDFESAAILNWADDLKQMIKSKPYLVKPPSQALHWAAFGGSKEAVEVLLDNGAVLDVGLAINGPWMGATALSLAVTGHHYDVAEMLLKRGASIDVNAIVGNGTESLSTYVRNHLDQKWQTLFANHLLEGSQKN